MSTRDAIIAQLQLLGFSQVGVAIPDPTLNLEENYYSEWLAKQYHGQMEYLSKLSRKRLHPELILPGLRSIIVASYFYQAPIDESEEYSISSYTQGGDYHKKLGKKQKEFAQWFGKKFPEHRLYTETDTGPVLEKVWAKRAGLGWMGKHTNVIHPQKGSYFFLATFLTDLELTPSTPLADHCGHCTRCIEVCPTQAIITPYQLDARLCISYLTIELRGPIPRDLRPLIGNHLFGCDDCQAVCPWNRFATSSHETIVIEQTSFEKLSLQGFLNFTEENFRQHFKGTAVLRCKYQGFIRNALVVAGNSKNNLYFESVAKRLTDPDPILRGHAVWALGQIDLQKARAYFEMLKQTEREPFVLEEIRSIMSF